jgi:cell division septation protein DedD
MVGRGVRDATIAAAGTDLPVGSELTPVSEKDVTPADIRSELDYQKRLESPQVEARLEETSSSAETLVADASKKQSTGQSATAPPAPSKPKAKPAEPPKKTPVSRGSSTSSKLLGSPQGAVTIQVVALKTGDAAEKLVSRLQAKGYRAYIESGGATNLHRVRVGRFASRAEAEKVLAKLRDVEKFKPYITQ